MRIALEIVILVLVLGRLAYDEFLIWYVGDTNCTCEHKPGCPFNEEDEEE